MIRVLIVEDSPTVGIYMEWLFSQEEDMEVIGRVTNGKEAISFVKKDKPDVITMDIEMPVMNGLEATRVIMSTDALPIVIVTASRNARETKMTMDALAAGALTLIEKPRGGPSESGSISAVEMITTIRLMAGVKVITRKMPAIVKSNVILPLTRREMVKKELQNLRIIVIGVSTGGPVLLKDLFSQLGSDFPLPILVVQHIASGFIQGMVDWLSGLLKIKIKTASEGERIQGGKVYFAPDDRHLTIDSQGLLRLKKNCGDHICPSVAQLFRSTYESYGKQTLAILLTGMGDDGAREMKLLHDAGAMTIAQHQDSALIFGKPGEAVKLKGVTHLLRTNEIMQLLKKIEMDFKKFN